MKKLFLSLTLTLSVVCQATCIESDTNLRNSLISAIAHNDFNAVKTVLQDFPAMTKEEQDEFLEVANVMITNSVAWYNKHHNHAEIGKDTFKAFGYWIATVLSGTATAISAGIIASTIEAYSEQEKEFRLERLPKLSYTIPTTAIFAGLTGFLAYKTMQKMTTAWMKPSQRLENSLHIKDAILHHPTI